MFVSFEAKTCRGRDNSLHSAQFLRDKSGDLSKIAALDQDCKIVSTAHQPATFDLVETGYPLRETIEAAYQTITAQARNQYTLGYTTPQGASSAYRDIEVRVKRPGLLVTARHGYYPLPPQRETPQAEPADANQKPGTPPGNPQ